MKKWLRSLSIHAKEGIRLKTTQHIPLGVHNNYPYPHFCVKSRFRYYIEEEHVRSLLNSEGIESTLVSDIKIFKNFWSSSYYIEVRKGGSIIFILKDSDVKCVISKNKSKGKKDFEVPTWPFKGLFRFIRSAKATFEILKTTFPDFVVNHEYYSTYAAFGREV